MDATDRRADRIEPGYGCRHCERQLSRREGAMVCPTCSLRVPIVDGIPRFPVSADGSSSETIFDRLAPIYETPLWFRPLYRFVGGPTAPRNDRARIATLLGLAGDHDGERGGGSERGNANSDERDGPTVLDVACGTGRFTRHVAPDAASVAGIDVSAGMLERAQRYAAREGLENVAFARMSADDLWFEADAFDRAACCWALHLFPDVDAALSEIRRVLRPGGRFAGGALVDEFVFDAPPVRAVARGALDADPFAVDDLEERLRTAGFSRIAFDRRGAALFFRADAE